MAIQASQMEADILAVERRVLDLYRRILYMDQTRVPTLEQSLNQLWSVAGQQTNGYLYVYSWSETGPLENTNVVVTLGSGGPVLFDGYTNAFGGCVVNVPSSGSYYVECSPEDEENRMSYTTINNPVEFTLIPGTTTSFALNTLAWLYTSNLKITDSTTGLSATLANNGAPPGNIGWFWNTGVPGVPESNWTNFAIEFLNADQYSLALPTYFGSPYSSVFYTTGDVQLLFLPYSQTWEPPLNLNYQSDESDPTTAEYISAIYGQSSTLYKITPA